MLPAVIFTAVKTRPERANGSAAVYPSPLPARLWAPEAAGPARPARRWRGAGSAELLLGQERHLRKPLCVQSKISPLVFIIIPRDAVFTVNQSRGSGAGRGREAVAPTGLRACPGPRAAPAQRWAPKGQLLKITNT